MTKILTSRKVFSQCHGLAALAAQRGCSLRLQSYIEAVELQPWDTYPRMLYEADCDNCMVWWPPAEHRGSYLRV